MQEDWQRRYFGMWVVVNRQSGRFLERIGHKQTECYPGVEIAWMLSRPCWGQGSAYKGCMAAIEWGFSHLDQQSIRLAEGWGETLTGSTLIQGKYLLQSRISRDDWADFRQRSTPNERYQKN